MTVEDFAAVDEGLVDRVIGGKFTIRECIGVGASGAVYQADQLALGRTVAVKILREELAGDPRLVKRFHDEALAASRLNHPNTVSVIDYGQTEDGLLYLAMEYLRGLTLTEMLGSPALSDALIAEVVVQVLSGLEEAHEAGVVHADLKADNIIVEHRRADWYLAKVVDFGISRLIGAPDDESERTICGTPEYMAPEVIRGAEPTFASDIYAVGVLLYELLCGETPFVADAPMEILSRHLRERPRPPNELASRPIDPGLEEAALRALSKDPNERFQSAKEFRSAIASRVKRVAASTDETVCPACGVQSSSSFKFCPECGHARTAFAETQEVDASEIAKASRARRVTATKRFSHIIDTDASAGGIFPLPMVGREDERRRLAAFLGEDDDSHMVQIVGPRGVGRTRLVREACRDLERTVIYSTNADPSGLAAAFYPIRTLVASILDLPPVADEAAISAAVIGAGLSERDVPGVGELFGLEGKLRELDPQVRRRELIVATSRVLLEAVKDTRTIFVFRNVDRYDHPSQDVLRRLAEAEPETPLRVVVTNGPEFAPHWPGLVARINLSPLSFEDVATLADHFESFSAVELPSAEQLEQCSGVPSHILHLTRFVVEGGNADTAPEGLADLIASRFDAMPRITGQVCQALAIFGAEAGPNVLHSALDDKVAEEQFEEALALLTARGFIEEEQKQIVFTDTLVRDVVYESTPANVRRELHASAARELSRVTGDPALLGHHADLADDFERGAPLLAAAGDRAVAQLDDSGACVYYNRALSAARRLVLADDAPEYRTLYVTTSIKLADTLRVGGQLGLASGMLAEADHYCRDAPGLRAQLLRARSHIHSTEGASTRAIDTTREAIGFAITTGRRELLAELYLDLATMCLRSGDVQQAIYELSEGIDLVTAGDGARGDDGPRMLWRMVLRLSQLHASLGDRDQAITLGHHALRHAERAGSALGAARCQSVLAVQYERVGQHLTADELREAAVNKMRELGDRRGTAELLLAGARTTRTVSRISAASIHEARVLAEEVGWEEGVRRATQAGD